MDNRGELYQMWSIQESLLQQYRSMAITLMGLISAGILVAISHISSTWATLDGILFAGRVPPLKDIADLVIFCMMVTLLILGVRAGKHFSLITSQRARLVTFFQNLFIAEENGQLESIAHRCDITYPIALLGALRRVSNPTFTPMTFEDAGNQDAFNRFAADILQHGGQNEDDAVRHDKARTFLSTAMFSVFRWFFGFSGLFAGITLIHLF